MCQKHKCRKVEVANYSAWSNGVVERSNSSTLKLLRLYCRTNVGNWPDAIPQISNVFNNTLNITLGDTPAYVIFGRDTHSNTDDFPKITSESNEQSIKLINRENTFNRAKAFFKNHLENAKAKYHSRINKRRKENEFHIGNRVLIWNIRNKNKLEDRYLGPATITKVNPTSVSVKLNEKTLDRINKNYLLKLNSPTVH